ncbi:MULTISPECIES: hypothetical protein [Mycolicibacter]|uniref:Uncharacterized protein n=2 Tax=Mycolicibacter TaxID=1073531 RepID=A0ABU5XL89_9MYCO|nr:MULTISPECIES: hypothetical protein [unclassified Mycolicibacter]MEB3023050.1 hypothetical protein [Mycolicibacter sp. MYC098]MEB3033560.1 hypothetical protein [Mycolicibacter sp. MYC340]
MIDIQVTVDDADHLFFRRPRRVVDAMTAAGIDGVRSVTVLDRSTGLTSTCHDNHV